MDALLTGVGQTHNARCRARRRSVQQNREPVGIAELKVYRGKKVENSVEARCVGSARSEAHELSRFRNGLTAGI